VSIIIRGKNVPIHVMKAYGAVEVENHPLLASALEAKRLASRPDH